MSNWNINAGYGQVIGQLPFQPTGSVFVVGDSGTINRDRIRQLFGPDADGRVRYYATLQAAINQASNNAADTVYILPGHTETIDSTGDVLLDVPGLTIEGLGQGDDIPLFNITSTSGKIQITENDTTLKNVRIRPGAGSSGGVIGLELLSTQAARNITLDGVVWGPISSASANFDTLIALGTNSSGSNYFDGLTIKNNVFQYYTTSITGAGNGINLVVAALDNFSFVNNLGSVVSSGTFLQSSGTSYGWDISFNRIHNLSTSLISIDLNGTAIYGNMAHNVFSNESTGAFGASVLDSGAMKMTETYICNASAADRTGRLPQATIT